MILKTTPNQKHAKPRSLRRSTVQYTYLITIIKHAKLAPVSKTDLDEVLAVLIGIQHIKIINIAYEISGLYSQLHLHLICRSSSGLRFTKLSKYNGFRIHYARLHTQADFHRAQVYCAKDQYQYLPHALLA